MDWEHEGLPPFGTVAHVWLKDGSVREAERHPMMHDLRFLDCVQPIQNTICQRDAVVAWRVIENRPVTPIAYLVLPYMNSPWAGHSLQWQQT